MECSHSGDTYAPADRAPAAVAGFLHHRPPLCRTDLPGPPADADRMAAGGDLGRLCGQPIPDRPQDRAGDAVRTRTAVLNEAASVRRDETLGASASRAG